jgi:replicative DNA helicase
MENNANLGSKTDRLPPHDLAAEECVIGSLLIDGEQIINVGKLMPADFYHEPHMIIFTAMQTLYSRHDAINTITVATELDRIGKLEFCGGVAYLSHVITEVPTPLDCDSYAAIVVRYSISRKAIILGQKIENVGFESLPDQQQTVEKVTGLVTDFRKNIGKFGSVITPRETADMTLDLLTKYKNKTPGILWAWPNIQKMTCGIQPAELIIIGARPSVGKSQIMLEAAEDVDRQGKNVLFVSAEMSIEHLIERKVSRVLRKGIRELRRGHITESDEDIITNKAGELSESHIYWMTTGTSSTAIYSEALRLHEQIGLDIVFVDYLQKLSDCYDLKENQNIRVGRACKTLKDLAFDLNIPVITASQLSRGIEHREDPVPTLSDLRDSGSIEQDADVVFLLHRDIDGQAQDGGEHDPSVLFIKMAKNRQLGTAPHQELHWNEEQHRYLCYGVPEEDATQDGLF